MPLLHKILQFDIRNIYLKVTCNVNPSLPACYFWTWNYVGYFAFDFDRNVWVCVANFALGRIWICLNDQDLSFHPSVCPSWRTFYSVPGHHSDFGRHFHRHYVCQGCESFRQGKRKGIENNLNPQSDLKIRHSLLQLRIVLVSPMTDTYYNLDYFGQSYD